MNKFEKALINAEVEKQTKDQIKKAKAKYIKDLISQGIDKQMAKIMADVNFEYGIVNAM